MNKKLISILCFSLVPFAMSFAAPAPSTTNTTDSKGVTLSSFNVQDEQLDVHSTDQSEQIDTSVILEEGAEDEGMGNYVEHVDDGTGTPPKSLELN